MTSHRPSKTVAVVAASLLALTTAQGVDAGSEPDEAPTSSEPVWTTDETLVVAIETSYPPIGFVDPDTGENVGFLTDLLVAMADDMDIELELVETEFEQLIPSLQTGRIDISAGGMTDTEERRELIDFVDYIATGPQPFTTAEMAEEFTSLEDMCGEEVGTPSFTNYVAQLEEWSEENCPEDEQISVVGTEGASATITQMEQGRRHIGVLGAEFVADLVNRSRPDEYVRFAEPFSEDYFGLGFSKDDTEMRDGFAASLERLIADGTYDEILADWGMEALAIDGVRVNAEPVD